MNTKKKPFIITIDTESDNQWQHGREQTTQNAYYIPRFQELCEKYNFKPVYLVDYSMTQNEWLVEYLKDCIVRGTCEIGMHLHAWDTPPICDMDKNKFGRPYLIEYSDLVMKEKIQNMHYDLTNKFNAEIVSHRAGRWAIDERYISNLVELGYKVDCSVTPGIDWTKTQGVTRGGSNYLKSSHEPFWLDKQRTLLEIPMTIEKLHLCNTTYEWKNILQEVIKFVVGRNVWLRPALYDNITMIQLLKKQNLQYAEFMMHSSEMMPGGSPYFPDFESIEVLYENLEMLFEYINNYYVGTTLHEYYLQYCKQI